MADIVNSSKYMYELYFLNGIYLAFYVLSLLYLLVYEKNKLTKKLFIGQVLLFSVIYWCPVTAYIIAEYCIGREVYWRMFWLLSVTILIAYVMTKIWKDAKGRMTQICVFFILVFVISNFGNIVYNETTFVESTNPYKLNQNVIEVCDAVKVHAQENGVTEYGIIAPNELVMEIRQYDGLMRMPYGRDMIRGMGMYGLPEAIYVRMNAAPLDTNTIADLAREGNYQYLAYSALTDQSIFLEAGYTFVQTAGEYNVYYLP